MVVRPPVGTVALSCGGTARVGPGEPAARAVVEPGEGLHQGTRLGKRYTDEESELEVLCTKSGRGSLSVGARPLVEKSAKPLPSSD